LLEPKTKAGYPRSPVIIERGPAEKKRTGKEHWSPLANASLDQDGYPECHVVNCDFKAQGCEIMAFDGGTMVTRWSCQAHGKPFPPITAKAVHPQFEVLGRHERGVYILRKRSRAEQLEAVKRQRR
jgi:hypothetical protein